MSELCCGRLWCLSQHRVPPPFPQIPPAAIPTVGDNCLTAPTNFRRSYPNCRGQLRHGSDKLPPQLPPLSGTLSQCSYPHCRGLCRSAATPTVAAILSCALGMVAHSAPHRGTPLHRAAQNSPTRQPGSPPRYPCHRRWGKSSPPLATPQLPGARGTLPHHSGAKRRMSGR